MNKFSLLLIALIGFISFTQLGCVKDDFDAPLPNGQDPEISPDDIVPFDQVLDILVTGQFLEVGLDKYIQGIVVADDESGSFYKSLVVEDENSDLGITILIDENNLAAKYPIGRRVFIDLSDLWISDYNNLPQLGFGPYDDDGQERMSQVPGVLAEKIILRGQYGLTVEPTLVESVTQLGNSKLNTLIKLENVQFGLGDAGGMWADAVSEIGFNLNLEDCNENNIIVRSSAFSTFAAEIVPSGKGTIIAVYSIFRDDKQLLIRSLEDVQLNENRCGPGGVDGERQSIKSIRDLYTGTPTVGPEGFIEGIVISDFANANITGRNIVLQDDERGIVVRFDENHSYKLGDKIQVGVDGIEISEFNGTLQLNNVPLGGSGLVGNGSITPATVSIGDILQDFENYESTLIKIENPMATGGPTLGDGVTLSDNSGSILLFTRGFSSFAGEALPETIKSVIGIVGEFTEASFNPQILMRNINDIDGEGGNTGGDEGINEDFNGGSDNDNIEITNWENVIVVGERAWIKKTFDNDGYAQASAFNDTSPSMETWLVSPEVDATTYPTLSFESAQAFYAHEGLSVWITDDYKGDIASTSWTPISAPIAGSSSSDHEWVLSGDIDIASYGAKTRIGFKYEGSGSNGNTTSYRIDKVVVK